jgi:hypothetical protein
LGYHQQASGPGLSALVFCVADHVSFSLSLTLYNSSQTIAQKRKNLNKVTAGCEKKKALPRGRISGGPSLRLHVGCLRLSGRNLDKNLTVYSPSSQWPLVRG